ncbi:SRPBCC family protein [Rhodococcus sp. 2H158]
MRRHPALTWGGRLVPVVPLLYLTVYRPWQLRWGATRTEVAQRGPGDEIVPSPHWSATRAVSIAADPEDVWPWLVQMGAGDRAGWYSYDLADNGGKPSAREIRPELQRLEVGDPVRLVAGSPAAFRVESIDPGRSLVYAHSHDGGTVTAALVLRPDGPGRSRLVHRVRFRIPPSPFAVGWAALMDAGDFVMSRRMLLGIRDRAERHARRRRGGPPPVDESPGTTMDFRLRIPVRRPPGAAFALLADVQEHAGVPARTGVRMSKSPPGPTAEGTRWHERVRLAPGWWMSVDSVVTAIEDPELLGMDFRSAWFAGHLDYRIESTPGGCLLRQHFVLRLPRPLRSWSARVDARLRPRLLDRLAEVRDAIEQDV